jgi:hypothetical protein
MRKRLSSNEDLFALLITHLSGLDDGLEGRGWSKREVGSHFYYHFIITYTRWVQGSIDTGCPGLASSSGKATGPNPNPPPPADDPKTKAEEEAKKKAEEEAKKNAAAGGPSFEWEFTDDVSSYSFNCLYHLTGIN